MKPLDRSGIIRQSVSVLVHGFAGFLPFIGFIPAVSAIIQGIRIRRAYPGPNPVDHYRKMGMAIGGLCVLLNASIIIIVAVHLIDLFNQGYWFNMD